MSVVNVAKTVSLPYAQCLFEYLGDQGINIPEFLSQFDFDSDSIKNESKRISLETFSCLFDEGVKLTRDVDLGLHVGEGIKPGHYGVLGYSVMSCTYFEEALQRHIRYQNLVADIGCAKLVKREDDVSIIWDTGLKAPSRQVAEHNIAAWVSYAKWISGLNSSPLRIDFQHKQPDSLKEHQRIFNCPMQFEQDKTAIIFSSELLALALPQKDTMIRDMMDKHAEKLLSKQNVGEAFVHEVSEYLSKSLDGGACDLELVASHFGMSSRTFQRKLKDHNLTYHDVLDSVRKELAMHYIQDSSIDLSELAFVLGFSEQSSFQRAFKRWSDSSPGKYRKGIKS